jgi:hypothetical protein
MGKNISAGLKSRKGGFVVSDNKDKFVVLARRPGTASRRSASTARTRRIGRRALRVRSCGVQLGAELAFNWCGWCGTGVQLVWHWRSACAALLACPLARELMCRTVNRRLLLTFMALSACTHAQTIHPPTHTHTHNIPSPPTRASAPLLFPLSLRPLLPPTPQFSSPNPEDPHHTGCGDVSAFSCVRGRVSGWLCSR